MKIKEGFVVRQMLDEYMIIPLGENALEYCGMITTNEVGCDIWNYLQEEHTEEELVDYMLDLYEVDREVLMTDIRKFIETAEKYRLFVSE